MVGERGLTLLLPVDTTWRASTALLVQRVVQSRTRPAMTPSCYTATLHTGLYSLLIGYHGGSSTHTTSILRLRSVISFPSSPPRHAFLPLLLLVCSTSVNMTCSVALMIGVVMLALLGVWVELPVVTAQTGTGVGGGYCFNGSVSSAPLESPTRVLSLIHITLTLPSLLCCACVL